jgi:hypothetical protein
VACAVLGMNFDSSARSLAAAEEAHTNNFGQQCALSSSSQRERMSPAAVSQQTSVYTVSDSFAAAQCTHEAAD